MNKIRAIIEAFSIQPATREVCRYEHEHTERCIKNIEIRQVGSYEFELCGFFFNDTEAFVYQGKSVNIEYFNEIQQPPIDDLPY